MMTPSPKFSVVIPTCHRNETLAACLAQLAPGVQKLPAADYEVIVSDDGAKSTAELLVREQFPWARWIKGPRRGPAANRNCGAALARGEWLAFTDDDCLPDPEWLEAFARAAAGRETPILEGRTVSGRPLGGPYETAPVNEKGGLLWSCNFAVRVPIFQALGGFDEGFPSPHMEDVDFYRRVQAAKWPTIFVPAARVVHPPRPIAPLWRHVKNHRSHFYYARKHGLSLPMSGFSLNVFIRGRGRALLSSRTAWEAVCYGSRIAAEFVLLTGAAAWWSVAERKRNQP